MKYRPDVEGLRALAIIPVVLYHADSTLMPGGFVGVDLFFVISGFLITSIIVAELDRQEFSLAGFYVRRIRRIFPALFFMLAAVFVAACLILSPQDMAEFGRTLIAAVLFVSNIQFAALSGYFDGPSELRPLLHTWSLAVEEQFYIVFPLLLMATRKWFKGRYAWVIMPCAILSLASCIWMLPRAPTAAFFLSKYRAYELLIGAVIAVGALPQLNRRILREALSLLGIAMLIASMLLFEDTTPFPGMHALLPCVGGALIIYAGRDGSSLVARTLSLPPIRFIGLISYALYLWHWPILVFARHYFFMDLSAVQIALAILLAFAMAVISWKFVEQPFRRGHASSASWRPFLVAAACMAVLATLGNAALRSDGLPQRYSQRALDMFAAGSAFNPLRRQCHAGRHRPISYEKNCIYGAPGVAPRVALWGDSYGADLVVSLGELAARHGESIMQITSSACPPALDYNPRRRPKCAAHNQQQFNKLIADPRISEVLLIGYFGEFQEDGWPELEAGLMKAAVALDRAGKRVTVIYPWPAYKYSVPAALGALISRGRSPDEYSMPLAEFHRTDAKALALLDRVAAAAHARRILPEDVLCAGGSCKTFDGVPLYHDDIHISVAGGRKLAAAFPPIFGINRAASPQTP